MKVKIAKEEIRAAMHRMGHEGDFLILETEPLDPHGADHFERVGKASRVTREENANKGGPCHAGVNYHEVCTFKGCVCACHREAASPTEECCYKCAERLATEKRDICRDLQCSCHHKEQARSIEMFNRWGGKEQPKCNCMEFPTPFDLHINTCPLFEEQPEKPKQPILKLNIVGRDGVSFKSVEVLMEAKINEIIDALYPLTKSQ